MIREEIDNNKRLFSWKPKNLDIFLETYDSIEEAVKDAQEQFDSKLGLYDEVSEYNSTVIHLMRVRKFNPEKQLDEFGDDVIDYLQMQLEGFTSGCGGDAQVEVRDSDAFNLAVKQALLPIIDKHLSFYFDMVGDVLTLEYDLNKRKYVLDGKEYGEEILEIYSK